MSFIQFGEWLPDLPDVATPGLTEAFNVVPSDSSYRELRSLTATGDALDARCRGAYAASDEDGSVIIYAGDAAKLYKRNSTSWDEVATSLATPADGYWKFTQYGNHILATNFQDDVLISTVGAASMSAVSGAPNAKHLGVIRNFVFAGDISDATYGHVPHAVQWSAIDDPTDWPIPLSQDAASKQSSREELNAAYGPVKFIADGESFGLVFQERAITRFTYVGGQVVFQVQPYERTRGAYAPNGCVQVGNITYFLAMDGFYATDGFKVEPIGAGRVNTWFLQDVDLSFVDRITAAVDTAKGVIVWSYCGTGGTLGIPSKLIMFNYRENRWSYGEQTVEMVFGGRSPGYTLDELDALGNLDQLGVSLDSAAWTGGYTVMQAFDSAHRLGEFAGTAKTAVLETAEVQLNGHGRAFVHKVKPVVERAGGITVSLGYRNDGAQDTAWGAPVSLHPRNREAHFRRDAYFHRARVTISGGFDSATGLHYFFEKAGDT